MKQQVVFVYLSLLLGLVYGHSYLINPTADWMIEKQPECRVGKPEDPDFGHLAPMNCPGPCGQTGPLSFRSNGEFFSLTKGNTKLSRGQKLYMKWTRNNHFGGFVRFTLVPKSKRMEKHVHDMFAFHFSCWEAGETRCDGHCGTDQKGKRFQTEVEIPSVFPDGEYVLGWTWYGGIRHRDGSEKSEYGDYYSCANIVIQGGNRVKAVHTPVFIPGMNDRSIRKCLSAVNRLGPCAREPCKRNGRRFEASHMVPHCFNGNSLKFDGSYRIRSSDVSTAQSGNLHYIDPCNGRQDSSADGQSALPTVPSRQNSGQRQGETAEDRRRRRSGRNNSPQPQQQNNGQEPKLIAMKLVDTSNGAIKGYAFNSPIDVNSFHHHMNIRVDVSNVQEVKALKFYIDGRLVRTEHSSPYYIAGATNGRLNPWRAPLNTKFALRLEVVGRIGKVFDNWTVYPTFKTGGLGRSLISDNVDWASVEDESLNEDVELVID